MIDRITIHPEICMGQPTIRGMRITVAFVLKLLASGMSHDEISATEISSRLNRRRIYKRAHLTGQVGQAEHAEIAEKIQCFRR